MLSYTFRPLPFPTPGTTPAESPFPLALERYCKVLGLPLCEWNFLTSFSCSAAAMKEQAWLDQELSFLHCRAWTTGQNSVSNGCPGVIVVMII